MLFIINPVAGAGRAGSCWTQFESQLKSAGLQSDKVFTQAKGEARSLAIAAAGKQPLIVAVGGDGTVSEVADGILGSEATQTILGVVCCGTGNDFARAVGILDSKDSLRALAGGRMALADVIRVECTANGKPSARHVLSFAAVGIAAEAQRQTTVVLKRMVGERWAYRLGIIRALFRYRAPLMRVTCDDRTWQERILFLCANNGENLGGGMRIAPGARIDDARFDVNLVQDLSWWQALAQLRRLSQGRHTGHPRVQYFQAATLEVHPDPPSEVAADGDIIGHTPARFEIRPGALRILVPP